MQKRLIIDSLQLPIIIDRLCFQLIENHFNFNQSVLLGLQPRGIFLAERIQRKLVSLMKNPVLIGQLDPTFHRDDFRRREEPIAASTTKIPFLIEDKKVILIDDVLFTGRTVRAALDTMITFGRPQKVELLTLINRKYSRDLPIEANYIGKSVNTMTNQKVLVEWKEQGHQKDSIWLIDKNTNEKP